MNRGTRRMWARRVLRAGWLVAPVLAFPGKAGRYLFIGDNNKFDFGKFIIVMFVSAILFGVTSCSVNVLHGNTVASAQDVSEAINGNRCMTEMMPRWMEHYKRPLTVLDLQEGQDMCDKAWKDFNNLEAQKKAMKEAK